jgi:hypothetical protein
MSKRYASRSGTTAVRYRIVIRGAIEQPLVGPLAGMTIDTVADESVIAGDIVDQAHLCGVIGWLTDLGVEIVSINPAPERASPG